MSSYLNFRVICEQIILEEDIKSVLINDIKPNIDLALKDYKHQKNNPQIDKKLLHNALWDELQDIKKEIAFKFKKHFNIDVNTPTKLDQFVNDKLLIFPFLKTLHSDFIKQI